MSGVNVILINEHRVPLYIEDDDISYRERLASVYHTIPKHVQKVSINELDKKEKNYISILLDDIDKDDSTSVYDFIIKNDIINKYVKENEKDEDKEDNERKEKVNLLMVIKLWFQYKKNILMKKFEDNIHHIFSIN